jgi:outer membrane protein TolC
MMRGGYLAGRLGYLEILDGQRSVLEANLLLVETHADVWRARTNLERMTGGMPASEEERR